ncbi:branched-chain amino acid ABC transporter substrate-binding protein [Desulfovibrio litoralis]|uniref:Branched-chain amino acid transport system substrate-binding protein n=1 Tax=Desulfovibrio litoralis DSM 11393 TaxID=1121455 RepID=A0A1M7SLT9_9BACT|nr:branched-chain amino acid ABC transporter substrate-binding protein [Desulfovibrio litoralis]SHN59437.1 branched-chain amino acid transport system substrate-binding protein [Desulfovibrio litoralis DSM 11393]
MNIKTPIKVLSAFILGSTLLSSVAKAEDVIKIGVATSQSGDFAQYGLPSLEAAKIVADELNAKGGILGKKVVIIPGDDQCKPELATNVATKMASEKVNAVIGHICSGATKAALPIYTKEKIIVISSAATSVDLTQSGEYPYFLRTIPPDDLQSKIAVDLVENQLKAKKIAIIHDKGDYGKNYVKFAKDFIEADKKASVVLFEGITPGQVDYSAIIKKVKNSGADALIFGGYHPEASKIVMQMKSKGLDIPFISSESIRTETFIKLAGKNSEGVYAAGTIDNSNLELYKKADADMKRVYNKQPGNFYFEAYAAMLALANAFETAGTTDPDKVLEVLRTKKTATPLGEIIFDQKGDLVGGGFQMYQVKNAKYVPISSK